MPTWPFSLFTHRQLLIGSCLLSVTHPAHGAASFESFGCAPTARDGIPLQNAHEFPGKDRAVECDYPSAGSCFYAPDGSLITQSASPNCPDSLADEQVSSETSAKTTEATEATEIAATSGSTNTPLPSSSSTGAPSPPQAPLSTPSAPTTENESLIASTSSAAKTVAGTTPTPPATFVSSSSSTSAAPIATGVVNNNINTSNKQSHTGAIAGGVTAAVVIVGILALILIRLRRRRRFRETRILQWRATTNQILGDRTALPAAGAMPQSNSFSPQLKSSTPQSVPTGKSTPDSEPAGSSAADATTGSETQNLTGEGRIPGGEGTTELAQRIRRMEAQVEALLTFGIPDTAPPGYAV
ncbi:hypothetical protein C8R43DRAFT_966823 [Mycena crocata]|nr:hypothetical protein C8R43DRAFT_966823 [Mycena crocata]